MSLLSESSDLAVALETAVHHRHLGATAAVLKYAPRRLRLENGDEAIARAQGDARYWRERAFKAETTLRALETRVRQLASRAQQSRSDLTP